MTFKTEREFEEALTNLLVTQKGWGGGVLRNPSEQDLIDNWARILFNINNETDRLNGVPLNDAEINQLINQINSLKSPLLKNDFINGSSVTIKRENPDDKSHFGKEISLKLFNRKEIAGGDSNYQIAKQPSFKGKDNIKGDFRGDFMLLINGLPVIHVELKRSGTPVSNAKNQVQRYIHNGVFADGLYSLVQVFVVMTPEEMRYFASPGNEPTSQINENYIFEWADFYNKPINDWKRAADLFLSIPMAHQLIGYYTVADKAENTLKVLRSYQINAAKKIFDRIQKINWHEQHQLGGYIWHTTGSGKTLTSFKAAELITSYGVSNKVIFLMDRIELGTQSLAEFRGFADFTEDIQDTKSTNDLLSKLKSDKTSDTLIVTSIQKMSRINDDETGQADLDKIREKRVVIIVDEAHRSTFGDMLIIIKKTLPDAIFFGFTGTPIHEENMRKDSTTATIFGDELHRYDLRDGIRDGNVLGFDVTQLETIDYDELRKEVALTKAKSKSVADVYKDPKKREVYEHYMDSTKVGMVGYRDEDTGKYFEGIETDYLYNDDFNNNEHREKVVEDILNNWDYLSKGSEYSALLATQSIPEAIEYYRLLKNNSKGIKVTALFDKNLDESEGSIFKEDGLAEVISDYNEMFDQNFNIPTHALFKQDLSQRLAHKGAYRRLKEEEKIHIVVVVNQLLTGYDSKWINTLYLDKTMEYANIIQAFSRTNRLNGDTKPFGSIRYYRMIHTMNENIERAVESYSGGRKLSLFVDKLGGNLASMNSVTEDITSVFSLDDIDNFERLPDDKDSRGKFAQLFNLFNSHLEAALIQGFAWDNDTYFAELRTNEPKKEIKVIFTEEMYNVWLLRYKELVQRGDGGDNPDEVSFDINYRLIQKDEKRIDHNYINNNFDRLVVSLNEGDTNEQRRIKNDLHRSFANLPREKQAYANMVINDLETGTLVVQGDKDFTDYINEYQERSESRNITQIVNAFGIDGEQLRNMMNLNITKRNINEFGRFTKLKDTADIKVAKDYLEKVLDKKLKIFEVNRITSNTLQDFILEDGFDLEEYLHRML